MKGIVSFIAGIVFIVVISIILLSPVSSSCSNWRCIKGIPDVIVDIEENSPSYGEMLICAIPATVSTVLNTWVNISDFEVGERNNFINTTSFNLVAQKSGTYEADFGISFAGAQKHDILIGISIGGVIPTSGCLARRTISVAGSYGVASTSCIVVVDEGDEIYLQINNLNGNQDITVVRSNLNLVRIDS